MTSDDVETSFISFANFCVENKREARKGSDSSAYCNSPVEKGVSWLLSSSNSSLKRSADVTELQSLRNADLFLEATAEIILSKLETMDEKLENISQSVSNLKT